DFYYINDDHPLTDSDPPGGFAILAKHTVSNSSDSPATALYRGSLLFPGRAFNVNPDTVLFAIALRLDWNGYPRRPTPKDPPADTLPSKSRAAQAAPAVASFTAYPQRAQPQPQTHFVQRGHLLL